MIFSIYQITSDLRYLYDIGFNLVAYISPREIILFANEDGDIKEYNASSYVHRHGPISGGFTFLANDVIKCLS